MFLCSFHFADIFVLLGVPKCFLGRLYFFSIGDVIYPEWHVKGCLETLDFTPWTMEDLEYNKCAE
jgi:hypothetical protein